MEREDPIKLFGTRSEKMEIAPLIKQGWATSADFGSIAHRVTNRVLPPKFVDDHIERVIQQILMEEPGAYPDLHYKVIGPNHMMSPDFQAKATGKLVDLFTS